MRPLIDLLPAQFSRPFPLFDDAPPDPQLHWSVVIPARNEASHLVQAFRALHAQRQLDDQPLSPRTYEVLLLLNNCTDQSLAVARQYQQQHPDFPLRIAVVQLPPEIANVGTARRLLMDEASKRLLQVGNPTGIIASTDGDTTVDPYWLAHIRAEMAQGCEAVGGRILTRPNTTGVRLNHLRDVTYRMLIARLESCLDPLPFDPWPRHFQHFGASIALTCTAYERIGGLPNVPYLEDEALYRALLRTDSRIRKSPQVRVMTSTRLQGQVEIGFSEQLRYWEELNRTQRGQLVEPAEAISRRIRAKNQLRLCWQERGTKPGARDVPSLATDLMVDADWLRQQLTQTAYFGQLWERVETQLAAGPWATFWPPVLITQAIADLRRMLRTL